LRTLIRWGGAVLLDGGALTVDWFTEESDYHLNRLRFVTGTALTPGERGRS
jgi:hypothetical protein